MADKKTYVNPKFLSGNSSGSVKMSSGNQVHINPNFRPPKRAAQPEPPKAHINPNFVLPKGTHVNPSRTSTSSSGAAIPQINKARAKAYEDAIKKALRDQTEAKKAKMTHPSMTSLSSNTSSGSSEKENHVSSKKVLTSPTTKAAKIMATPKSSKKSFFKKIGTRKLVRLNTPPNSNSSPTMLAPQTAPNPSAFRKIGHRKLVRVRSASGSKMSPATPRTKRMEYKVKTRRKIVKVTPQKTPTAKTPKRRHLFSTPFSAKLRQHSVSKWTPRKTSFSTVLSQFKLDRRKRKNSDAPVAAPTPPLPPLPKPERPATSVAPPKPMRKKPVKPATTLINVQGVRYSVTENGRKLKRLPDKVPEAPKPLPALPPPPVPSRPLAYKSLRKKFYLEGEEYVEDEPGILVRSRNSMTRASITSYKARSINTIIKSQTRSRQYCMFFNKFGKCNKKEKGMCPYIHDPEKVAVCRKFLHGNCTNFEACLLSHKVAPEKMPSCKFFLEGNCGRENCPYRHVKVNESAEMCIDFQRGFCPAGNECKKKHEERSKPRNKKVPPAKPQRKSMIIEPPPAKKEEEEKTQRYYDDKVEDEADDEGDEVVITEDFEVKRQRLMRKVDVVKQDPFPELESPNDSGPYEKIDEEEEQLPVYQERRPPLGDLPSYIALSSAEEGEELINCLNSSSKDIVLEADEDCEERLI